VSLGLTVPIKGDAGDLDKTLKGASGSVLGFGGDVAGTVSKVLPMAAAATGAAIAIGEMTKAAASDRDEQAKLTQTIASATRSTADYTAEVDAAIAAGQDRAFTDSETRDALASLVTATGDVNAATYQLAQAQDIARLAGVDLATAADAIAKADQGQDTQLRKLIPGLEKGTTATDTLANASRMAAGQADLFAASSEGMGIKTKDAFAEMGEQIGSVFLPILDALLPAILPILKAFGQLITAILPVLVPLIKVLGAALAQVAGIIATVVGWLVKLIGWLTKAIDLVGQLLGKIPGLNRVAGIVGGIGGQAAVAAAGPSAYGASTRSGGSSAPTTVVFNTYTTGDSLATEAAIARAVRRVLRINAGRPSWST
jgi:hypothetical protein